MWLARDSFGKASAMLVTWLAVEAQCNTPIALGHTLAIIHFNHDPEG